MFVYEYILKQLYKPGTYKKMEEIMKVPSQRQYERQLNLIRDPDLKKEWSKFYKKAKNAANIEAILHNTAGVAQLAWVPSDPNNPTLVDPRTKKLLGKYVLKVRRLDQMVDNNINNAPTIEVHPDSGWVEENFKPEILGSAQKLAIAFFEIKRNGRF